MDLTVVLLWGAPAPWMQSSPPRDSAMYKHQLDLGEFTPAASSSCTDFFLGIPSLKLT